MAITRQLGSNGFRRLAAGWSVLQSGTEACCECCYDTNCAYCNAGAPNSAKLVWAGCTFNPLDDWVDGDPVFPGNNFRWLQLANGQYVRALGSGTQGAGDIECHENMHFGMLTNSASACTWTKSWIQVSFQRRSAKTNAPGDLLETYDRVTATWTRLSDTTARLAVYLDKSGGASVKLYLFHGNATVTNDCRAEVVVTDDAGAADGGADPIDGTGYRINTGGTITVVPCTDDLVNVWSNSPTVTPPTSLYMDSAEYADLDPTCSPMVAAAGENAWAGEFRARNSLVYDSRDPTTPTTANVTCKVTIDGADYKMAVDLVGETLQTSYSWPPGYTLLWRDQSVGGTILPWKGKLSTGRWPEGVFHRVNGTYDGGDNCSTLPASMEITDTP